MHAYLICLYTFILFSSNSFVDLYYEIAKNKKGKTETNLVLFSGNPELLRGCDAKVKYN